MNENREKNFIKQDFEQNMRFLKNTHALSKGFIGGLAVGCLFGGVRSRVMFTALTSATVGLIYQNEKIKPIYNNYFKI